MSEYMLAWVEFLTGRFFFVIAGTIGVIIWLGTLYWANRNLGVKLSRDVLPKIYPSPMAVAVFFGLRFVGICIYLGALVFAGASVSTTYG